MRILLLRVRARLQRGHPRQAGILRDRQVGPEHRLLGRALAKTRHLLDGWAFDVHDDGLLLAETETAGA